MLTTTQQRARMVERHIVGRGVSNAAVIAAMYEVPRELFVSEALQQLAYADIPLPIDANQTISQPFIVALMIQAAEIAPEDRVLELGAGSGYGAAVLSRIAAKVYAIERVPVLALQAGERLRQLGYDNVEIRAGDGAHGWPDAAPFDAILVAAAAPAIPQALKDELDIGGVLVMPVGETQDDQRLMKVRRIGAKHFDEEDLGPVSFVPLISEARAGNENQVLRERAGPALTETQPKTPPAGKPS